MNSTSLDFETKKHKTDNLFQQLSIFSQWRHWRYFVCLFLVVWVVTVAFGQNPFSRQNSTTVNPGSSITTSTSVSVISKIIFASMNYNRTSQNLEGQNYLFSSISGLEK
jgi:hypothetical protein